MTRYVDEGVRLEVRMKGESERWQPIRYYIPSSTAASNVSNKDSIVHLYENSIVRAMAQNYTSNLPVHFVNSSETVTMREYICGNFIESLGDATIIRVRWMQRFGSIESMADQATWALDDVKIKLWNGSHFVRLLDEDFDSDSLDKEYKRPAVTIKYLLAAETVMTPPCGGLGTGKALYFRNNTDNNAISISRRSIVIDLLYHPEEIGEIIDPDNISKLATKAR